MKVVEWRIRRISECANFSAVNKLEFLRKSRTVRLSPSWSFRWDNRTHIEDIMDNPSQLSNQHSGNVSSEIKSLADTENECISEGSSPFSIHAPRWRKKVGIAGSSKSLFADQSPRSNFSSEDKYSFKSSSSPIIAKPSMSFTSPSSSSSSFKAPEPLLSNPSSSKKARKHNNEQLSLEESHESWSMRTFSELVAASAMKESWALFDANTPTSTSCSKSHQTCKICSKPMNEKSPWSAQKIVSTNELSIAAVLQCGHVYHDECLENITLDVNRYDPPCPVCTNASKMKLKGKTCRRGNADLKKPFLKRHFSVGSRSVSESEATRKRKGKGLLWGRYVSKN